MAWSLLGRVALTLFKHPLKIGGGLTALWGLTQDKDQDGKSATEETFEDIARYGRGAGEVLSNPWVLGIGAALIAVLGMLLKPILGICLALAIGTAAMNYFNPQGNEPAPEIEPAPEDGTLA